MTDRTRRRHTMLAAGLSFLFPGLGHAYVGRRDLAIVFAVPMLLLVTAALLTAFVFGDRVRNELLSQRFLMGVLAANVVLLIWRGAAIAHAWFSAPRRLAVEPAGPSRTAADPRRSALSIGSLVALLLLTVAMHAYVALVVDRLNSALGQVFSGAAGDQAAPPGVSSDDGEGPLNVPDYRWDGTDVMNFLLIGVDAGPGRDQALADGILVVSIDPVAEHAVIVSVPRDTGYLPLPDTTVYPDGVYPHKINELPAEAEDNPDIWCPDLGPGAPCGIRTLERSIGLYLGITIHYYALIDLVGFTELIDAVGGVELCLEGDLIDAQYRDLDGSRGIELPAGCHRYDGSDALAYTRIRMGYMEARDSSRQEQNDFLRSERQQQVLLALRRELAKADLVLELPGLLSAVGRTVVTDFPREQAGDLASLLPLIAGDHIEREVLALPDYVDPPVAPDVNYLLIPRREAIRDRMLELFGPELEGWYMTTDEAGPPAGDDNQAAGAFQVIGGRTAERDH